jgi:propionyl-CoA synthetase
MGYNQVYRAAKDDPNAFWMEAAKGIDWDVAPSRALFDDNAPFYEWFADGKLNGCWNAVDRHVQAGHGDRVAIIHDSPLTGTTHKITYKELKDRVASLAGALKAKGIEKGDRVIIYMPMVPEALEAMLACARLGAIHSVVFGGFAANELAVRIDDCEPKCIIAASCGIEPGRVVHYKPLLDGALELADHEPEFCVIFQREQEVAHLEEGRDHDWHAFQYGVEPADCVPVEGNHPAYILYTSGTTGQPKGVVRHTGGHLVALNWSMRNLYDMNPEEVFWAASDVGWVVGHSYICYAPLTFGCTTIVFEGKPVGTPDAGTFWRVIADTWGQVPLHRADSLPRDQARRPGRGAGGGLRPVVAGIAVPRRGTRRSRHHRVGTEAAWRAGDRPLVADRNRLGHRGQPAGDRETAGQDRLPLGRDAGLRRADPRRGRAPDETRGAWRHRGEAALAPGTLPTLWKAEDRYRKSYLTHFPGYYETGDAGMIDEDGYLYIMARTDDVINVAGHRLSTGGMEEVLAAHPDVAECAVIGVTDTLKGQLPMGFLCLNKGAETPPEQVVAECVKLVRDKIGPVAAFKLAVVVDRLPKTRSGKILRGTMVKIADGESYKMPATIDDPAILDEIGAAVAMLGYGSAKG